MGLLWTLLLNGLLGFGGYRGSRNLFRLPHGLQSVLGATVLAWSWLTLGMQVLGPWGYLSRVPLLAWVGAGAALATLAARFAPSTNDQPAPWSQRWTLDVLGPLAVALVLAVSATIGGAAIAGPVKVVSDGPIYHLYFAARWWRAGRLFLVAAPFGENAATYFPAGGDLWFTWLLVGWGGERLAKVGQTLFLVLAGLAAYELARMLGARRPAALIATCLFVSSTPFLIFSFEPNVDTMFVAGYLVACVFLVRYALYDGGTLALILAGLAAGCAWGTKPTGHVFIPPLLALGAVAIIGRRPLLKTAFGHLLLLVASALIPTGYWFGRNLLISGNPLYPLQVTVGDRPLLIGWYGAEAMKQSPYYIPRADWRAFVDILLGVLDPRELPLWLAALAGAWALSGKKGPHDRLVWACSFLALVNAGLYWILIPYRTQQRFMLQAVGVAVVPLARLLDSSRVLRFLGVLALVVHVFTPQVWPWTVQGVPWDFSPLIPSATTGLLPISRQSVVAAAFPVALALLSAAFWEYFRKRPNPTRLGVAVGATLALAAYGVLSAPSLPATRYGPAMFPPSFPDYYRGWIELDQRSGAGGTRVAYAGTNLPYYLMGSGLRNDVRYVNVDRHRDWLLHDYHREAVREGHPNWPTSRPGWDRLHPDYAAWLENLRAEEIQILVVCRANAAEGPHNVADAQSFPIERQWAESHPESFVPLYGVVEGEREFRIYRLRTPGAK